MVIESVDMTRNARSARRALPAGDINNLLHEGKAKGSLLLSKLEVPSNSWLVRHREADRANAEQGRPGNSWDPLYDRG